jgi:hypothetical protein
MCRVVNKIINAINGKCGFPEPEFNVFFSKGHRRPLLGLKAKQCKVGKKQ